MRRATRTAAVMAGLLVFPVGASSQSHQNGRTSPSTAAVNGSVGCDYDSCGLRLWDSDVLEGRTGERVAGFGFFRPPDMAQRFASSDSATSYLEVVEESYTRGRVIWFAGQVVSAVGALLYFSSEKSTQRWGLALQTAGFSAGWLGQRRVGRAEEAMSRAIWWYNRDVARTSAAAGRR